MAEVIETFNIDDWLIDTPTGWEEMSHSHKTIKYKIWILKTESFEIKCADDHKVVNSDGVKVLTKDLTVGQLINTRNGLEVVTEVYETDDEEYMYSPTVNSVNHTYYGNGIENANTTIVAVFALHYAMFNNDKTIAILAQQLDGAIEMVDRIKLILEYLPDFLKPGVKTYNKKSIVFENNCKIIANATTPKAVRGKSINCQTGDAVVTVRDTKTGIVEDLTFEELEQRLILLQAGIEPSESKIIDLS